MAIFPSAVIGLLLSDRGGPDRSILSAIMVAGGESRGVVQMSDCWSFLANPGEPSHGTEFRER
jgi:hypothetical protein